MKNKFGANIFKLLSDQGIRGATILDVLEEHPVLRRCYARPLGGVDNMTLRDHTLNVLECFENNFEGKSELLFEPQYFKLLLAFHDLGKPQAVSEKRFEKQHEYTTLIISALSLEDYLPIQTLGSIVAIIDGDPIGKYLNSKFEVPLKKALKEISIMANLVSVPIANLWPTLLVYYQCDAAGYESVRRKVFITDDAGRAIYFNERGGFELKNQDETKKFAILNKIVTRIFHP